MNNKIRLGFVGAGAISQRLMPHFLVEDTAKKVDVTGVCDPVLERAQAACDRFFPQGRAYVSLDDMLADDRIDAITIGSPIGLHAEQVLTAVRSGKHVHVNKTMTVTVAEADVIIAQAKRASVVVVASPGEMLRPHNIETKRLIDSGAIGTLAWAACGASFGSYHQAEPERQGNGALAGVDPSWYFRSPGGGPLYDLTVYSLHGLTGILGPVRRVSAFSGTLIPERDVQGRAVQVEAHDNTLMLLDFGGNRFAFAYGAAAGSLTPGVEFDFSSRFYGTEGEIVGLTLNGRPFDYFGRDLANSAADGGIFPNAGGNELVLPHITPEHYDLQELHVYEDIMQMVDWVREGIPSIVTAERARHVIDIIESGYRAAASGQVQELSTSF